MWKIEKWISDVFPGESKIYTAYSKLPPRELIITCAASLDLALAELISLRILDYPKEYEDFLGLNGDGRSPCGTFGSRIQLSILLGIITINDSEILRILKTLRNLYAHKVNVSLKDGEGYKLVCALLEKFRWLMTDILPTHKQELMDTNLDGIKKHFSETEEASCAIINTIFSIYQAYFHRIHERINRIDRPDFVDERRKA
jgi:hypothetical protein